MDCVLGYDNYVCALQTNNMRYPLFTLLCEDGDGFGQPVAFCVVVRESEDHIASFLQFFSDNNDISRTSVVVTDKDQAELNAIASCWPNVRHVLCQFHILTAFDRQLHSSALTPDEKKEVFEVRIQTPAYA